MMSRFPTLSIGCLIQFVGIVLQSLAINIDVKSPSIYSGPGESYFGFSLDFHMQEKGNVNIVVGAPKANTTQPGISQGGAVFLCPWSVNGSTCQVITFDSKGDQNFTYDTIKMRTYKSNQWFGASVSTHEDVIVACAPQLHWNVLMGKEESGVTPVGTCFITTTKSRTSVEYSPCRSDKTEAFYQRLSWAQDKRYCEAGFSSLVTKQGTLVLGAPGGYYFEGMIISSEISDIMKGYRSSAYPVNVAAQKQTREKNYDDGYKGYSVATGEFTNDSIPEYVVGIPNHNTEGLVEILLSTDYNLRTIKSFRSPQIASYFGHAVAVADINADGRDDILVGAPLFMDRRLDGKLYEVGQVSLFLQQKLYTFSEPQTLTGTDVYGRFGSAIAALGDLDQDGYMDIAVGAPFAGKDGQGQVFIYHGQSDGLQLDYSQVLESPFISQSMPAAFGFSLRGGSDIDSNGYPDLLVGAFGASKVAVYRARPVIIAEAQLLLNPDLLNLGNNFTVQICVTMTGKNIPEQIGLNAELQLDKMKPRLGRRTLFHDTQQPQKHFQLHIPKKEKQVCQTFSVYLRDESEFKDKLTPIIISLNFSLMATSADGTQDLSPVLRGQNSSQVQTRIVLDCGSDNICIPDLKLSASVNKEHLLIGEENSVLLLISSWNEGEGAYEAELHVHLPPDTHYMSVVRNKEGFSRLICNQKKENETHIVLCELGNPMRAGANVTAGVYLSVTNLEEVNSSVGFDLQVKSKKSYQPNSNVVHLEIGVRAVAVLEMRGGSSPAEIVLPMAMWLLQPHPKEPKDIGPAVEHTFELHNRGPGTVSEGQIEIMLPAHLLYILRVTGEIGMRCYENVDVDKLGLIPPTTTSAPNGTTRLDARRIDKREAKEPEMPIKKEPTYVNCNSSCVTIVCNISDLERGKHAVVKIHTLLWIKMFMERPYESFIIELTASYAVTKMPYKIQPEVFPNGTGKTLTQVLWITPDSEKEVPVLWIVLSVFAGLLLLTLLTFVMWKLGFFKRTLPPQGDMEELAPKSKANADAK